MRLPRRALLIPILLLALAGCAPSAAAPIPSTTPTPSATPTPKPTPSGPPEPVLGVACGDLIEPATVNAFFAGAPQAVALKRGEASPPDPQMEILYRQVGALRCVWGGDSRTDESYDVGIELTVLQDASSQFSAKLWNPADATDTVGDRSAFACAYGRCQFSVLVGDLWLVGRTSSRVDSDAGDTQLREQLTGLLASAASRVAQAPRNDAPSIDSASYMGWRGECREGDSITQLLRSASGLTPIIEQDPTSGREPFDVEVIARAQLSSCDVGDTTGDSFSVEVTPGAGWAVPELRKGGSYANYVHIEPTELPDGTPAATGFEGVFGVYYVAVDGSLVTISFARDSGDIADVPARVLAIVDGVRG